VEGNAVRTPLGVGNVLAGFGPSNWPQVDIIVISRTLEEHKRNLREVFLRLDPEKCQFFKKELLYLGHRVTREVIETYPEKVAAKAELEPPSTVKELRQYLGVVSWYRRFVTDFPRIVKSLNDMLRKGSKWEQAPDGV